MNLWDLNFWVLGPVPFWVIGLALFFLAYVQLRGLKVSEKILTALDSLTSELKKDELRTATSELKSDTFALSNLIVGLTKQLEKVATSIEAWHDSMRKIYFWIPLGDRTEERSKRVT